MKMAVLEDDMIFNIKFQTVELEKWLKQVRKLDALAEDLSVGPITQIVQLITNHSNYTDSSSREADTFFSGL